MNTLVTLLVRKRRLFELLAAQGMLANQQVTFLTDGADDVRDLPLYLNPQAEHLLDWFHVTMRLTVLTQLAKGLRAPPPAASADSVAAQLARLKWFCWHGNVFRALQTVEDLEFDLNVDGAGPEQRKLCKAVGEFGGYSCGPTLPASPTTASVTGLARSSPVPSPSPPSTRSSASGW